MLALNFVLLRGGNQKETFRSFFLKVCCLFYPSSPFQTIYGFWNLGIWLLFLFRCFFFCFSQTLPLICLPHFYSSNILHPSHLHPPTLSSSFLSAWLSLSVIVSQVLCRANLQSQLNWSVSTLLLPSSWGLFNDPLELSTLCVHSSLCPSLLICKNSAKCENQIKVQENPPK